MNESVPRLRMFAGPNGSGKTTIKNSLRKPASWFGIYINPDDIERTVRDTGSISLAPYRQTTTTAEVRRFFLSSQLLVRSGLVAGTEWIECSEDQVRFGSMTFTSYHAAVFAEFLRRKALLNSQSFSFETVMSSRDKIDLLRDAQSRGFRTYLYFVATEDPEINLRRVTNRVADGGHDVPEIKVRERYERSLKLVREALPLNNRAYFFDTSQATAWNFAEAEGMKLRLTSPNMPTWFEPIWNEFCLSDLENDLDPGEPHD